MDSFLLFSQLFGVDQYPGNETDHEKVVKLCLVAICGGGNGKCDEPGQEDSDDELHGAYIVPYERPLSSSKKNLTRQELWCTIDSHTVSPFKKAKVIQCLRARNST